MVNKARLDFPGDDFSKTYPLFRRIWTDPGSRFKKTLKITKTKPVSDCKECTGLRGELMVAKSKEEYAQIHCRRRRHIEDVRMEREQYHRIRKLAADHESDWLCIIIDGMDQAKTNIPRANGKRDRGDEKTIPTRIIGVKIHGRFQKFYIIPPDMPHDSNVTWSILLDCINQLKDEYGSLPSKLWVQMDNTATDNKNKLNFAIQRHLVSAGIFREAVFGFLPVGHTHEDIDQAFSRIATYLRGSRHTANSFPDLVHACTSAFSNVVTHAEVLREEKLRDFRRWLDDDFKTVMRGISTVHNVRFSNSLRDRQSEPVFQYKEWMRQADWIPVPTDRIPYPKEPHFLRPSISIINTTEADQIAELFIQDFRLESKIRRHQGRVRSGRDVHPGGRVGFNIGQQTEDRLVAAGIWLRNFVLQHRHRQDARCQDCIRHQTEILRFPDSGTQEQRTINRRNKNRAKQALLEHQKEGCQDDAQVDLEPYHFAEAKMLDDVKQRLAGRYDPQRQVKLHNDSHVCNRFSFW